MFFDLKSWGLLKNVKTRSGPYLGLGLSINVKKRNENLAGLSLSTNNNWAWTPVAYSKIDIIIKCFSCSCFKTFFKDYYREQQKEKKEKNISGKTESTI
jgi:hypothetical protein